jgi:hypothetical protein
MIPETLHHLADAIAALQKADDATKSGFVSDFTRNAMTEVFKALRCVGDEQIEGPHPEIEETAWTGKVGS